MSAEIPRQSTEKPVVVIDGSDPRSTFELLRTGVAHHIQNRRVNVTDIIPFRAVVDNGRVKIMEESLQTRTGQESTVGLRAREDPEQPGRVVFDITDGFHRTEAMRNVGIPQARADIYVNITEEEFADMRIRATTVRSVEWARTAGFVGDAWMLTEWGKSGMSVIDAFVMASRAGTDSGGKMKDPIGWARNKAKIWGKTTKYVASVLKVAALADPELIFQVRKSKAGRGRIDDLTPERLAGIVEVFPGSENFRFQRIIVDGVLKYHLSSRDTMLAAYDFMRAVEKGIPPGQEKLVMEQIAVLHATKDIPGFYRELDRTEGDDSEDETMTEDGGIELRRDQPVRTVRDILSEVGTTVFTRPNSAPVFLSSNGFGNVPSVGESRKQQGETAQEPKDTRGTPGVLGQMDDRDNVPLAPDGRIVDMETAQMEVGEQKGFIGGWEETAAYLDEQEKIAIRAIRNGTTVSQVQEQFGINSQQFLELIVSALDKQQTAFDNSTS